MKDGLALFYIKDDTVYPVSLLTGGLNDEL